MEEKDHGPEGRSHPYARGYDLLAQCADAEGLFAGPPVPAAPREELVLFSCAPLGLLRDAVDGRDGGRIGDVWIEGRAGEQGHSWRYVLSDAVVVGGRPCPSDERQRQFTFALSAAEGYTPYGSCAAVPRLFQPRKPRRR
ncbi:hypothetical protein [Streptomyces sp. NPDC005533]|uniref:hypothetical protein n=1 Tax=Streptomyces sp. NPDC005533 TaxID=3364723 RepID=UPI00368270B2